MKGIFFTMILIIVVLTLVSFIGVQKNLVSTYRQKLVVENRINRMNNFYSDMIMDCENVIGIITNEGIVVTISKIITTGNATTNSILTLKELILNGTYNETYEPLMENSTFGNWTDKMEELSSLSGFNTNIAYENLQIEQYDSFNLLVSIQLYINITDRQTNASLRKNETVNRFVSIEGFEDPIYPLYTLGRATNTIIRTPYWGNFTNNLITGTGSNGWFRGISVILPSSDPSISFVDQPNEKVLVTDNTAPITPGTLNSFGAVIFDSGTNGSKPYVKATNPMNVLPNNTYILVDGNNGKVWYIENFVTTVTDSYYSPSLNGSTFLERLEGKLKSEIYTGKILGIETFVDKNYFSALGLTVYPDKTNIDHLYFSGGSYIGSKIKGLDDPNIRIDNELCTYDISHDLIYNVSNILY